MPQAHQSTEQVQAQQAAKDDKQLAQAQSHQQTIQKASHIEAEIHQTQEDKYDSDAQQEHKELEEGEISASTITVETGGASEDESPESEELKGCDREGHEQHKRCQKVVKSKKGMLREQTQSHVGLPSTPELSKQKCKRASTGKSKSKKGELQAQIQSDVGPPSTPEPSQQKHKAPMEEHYDSKGTHLADSDELNEVGRLSENEGPPEAYSTSASDTHHYLGPGGISLRKLAPHTEVPLEDDINCIWATVFPAEDTVDFTTPLGGMIHKLILDCLSNWSHSIANAGLLALQMKVFSNLQAGDQGGNFTMAQREWCTWAVSHTEENHPFYFTGVVQDAGGNVQSQTVHLFVYFIHLLVLTQT
ncbi:hypothetical protein EI94DRAFT_1708995 [Lactarius quietus]|nr:hypothetical protein EI94DRAFT_1708995 [Lactarius quietus]